MAVNDRVASVQQLQGQVAGSVLTAADQDYEQTRRGWNRSIDQRPAAILIAENAQDVVAGVRFARKEGLGVAVQSTGHGVHLPADENLLIVTSRMASVHVDAAARTARVEAGVIWKQVLDMTTPHGLAPLLGSSPHVGVIGYTLGGGIGWLARRYGFAADSVRWIDIVTADGVQRRASLTENSDLFWGLRGGGGNFGVVTAMEFDLYPVRTIYGGSLTYPAERIGDALRFFRDWTRTVPETLTSSIAIMKIPPLPQVPEALRGKRLAIVRAAFAGDPAEGETLMKTWLNWQTPISNTFQQMPFSEIGAISNDPVDPVESIVSNALFDDLSDDAIELIVRHATDTTSPLVVNELRHAGGAITRVDAGANAISNRDAQFYFQIGGIVFNPEARTAIKAYIKQYKDALRPYFRRGVYLNFMSGSEARDRAKDAYLPATYQRLLTLKAEYDPENMFRFSYQLVGS